MSPSTKEKGSSKFVVSGLVDQYMISNVIKICVAENQNSVYLFPVLSSLIHVWKSLLLLKKKVKVFYLLI